MSGRVRLRTFRIRDCRGGVPDTLPCRGRQRLRRPPPADKSKDLAQSGVAASLKTNDSTADAQGAPEFAGRGPGERDVLEGLHITGVVRQQALDRGHVGVVEL